MNKETKVGLLVGLAFVIVIGIYLSDHASNTNQAPPALLVGAGRSALASTGDNGFEDSPVVIKVPSAVTPRGQIPTKKDLNQRKPATPPRVVEEPIHTVTPGNSEEAMTDLEKKARDMGEQIVPADPGTQVLPQQPVQPKAPTAQTRKYIAQAGDSLGTIAKKAYGSSCLANRKAIMAANPFMSDNQDMIVAGRTYTIPPVATAPVVPATEQPAVNPTPTTPTPTAAAVMIYTVQSGDSLYSIARKQVGSTAAVATIKQLNEDVLHGSNNLREGLKLRLPKKVSE